MPTLLTPKQIAKRLATLHGWAIANDELQKTFSFKNYYETTAFLNATAWISHRSDHHPDIALGFNKITLKYTTHSAKGLTAADFDAATKVEALLTL